MSKHDSEEAHGVFSAAGTWGCTGGKDEAGGGQRPELKALV